MTLSAAGQRLLPHSSPTWWEERHPSTETTAMIAGKIASTP